MRGKQGQAAAVRHNIESRDAQIVVYQRNIARLTAETKELRATLDIERREQQRHVRELRARLDLGAAPKVEALELLMAQRTKERDSAQSDLGAFRDRWGRTVIRFRDHFVDQHKMPKHEAFEAAITIVVPDMAEHLLADERIANERDLSDDVLRERVTALHRKRGLRK